MKAIMISIKPKWCAKIMNGEKTIEVRKNKALASAIKKLINENGYADIYVYCSKDDVLMKNIQKTGYIYHSGKFAKRLKRNFHNEEYPILNGKVVFKFRCYKVEEIKSGYYVDRFILNKSCLNHREMSSYLKGKVGYAIHISDLVIFDKPKELSEFRSYKKNIVNTKINGMVFETELDNSLTKAPQNMVYIEIEDSTHI